SSDVCSSDLGDGELLPIFLDLSRQKLDVEARIDAVPAAGHAKSGGDGADRRGAQILLPSRWSHAERPQGLLYGLDGGPAERGLEAVDELLAASLRQDEDVIQVPDSLFVLLQQHAAADRLQIGRAHV